MRSPTTDVASTQSSELAHPSYFSNPALLDDNNLPSLHVDSDNSLQTPTRGSVENHPLPHINAQALIHTLHTFYLPLPLPPPHDPPYFCALMNSLSICSLLVLPLARASASKTLEPKNAKLLFLGELFANFQPARFGFDQRAFHIDKL